MIIPTLLFYVFAFLLLASAFAVISARNPVHSVLFLILGFFNAAGLFLLLGAEYLAMTLVIVYVGAVAVLFLFVVMMLDINITELRQGFMRYLPVGALVAIVFLAELILVCSASLAKPSLIHPAPAMTPLGQGAAPLSNTQLLGNVIYTEYGLVFQLAGAILLVAMIGAIVLTHRTRPGVRRQNIASQIARRRSASIALVAREPGQGAA